MIDVEVARLRKLRNVALRARAVAKILDSDSAAEHEGQSVFTRTAVACWTIARIASGRLRAHPYLSYQQGRSALRGVADGLSASLTALSARRQNRRVQICAQQLQTLARDVDDVRALTLSPELSDALGRMQVRMLRLGNELNLDARKEGGELPRASILACSETSDALQERAADNSWPYLAI